MKAITVTQELKDANATLFSNNAVGSIKQLNLPTSFVSLNYNAGQLTQGYQTLDVGIHESDGFYDVVIPSYNTATEKLGALFFDVTVFTYPVIALTDEEIQAPLIAESEARQQEIIQADIVLKAQESAQASDDTVSLDNQDLFPMWSGDSVQYTLDYKVQAFNAQNELKLYRVVQAHTSQSDWKPYLVPALFTVVAYPGEIPVFVQPTGAQDAYNIDDLVHYPTITDPVYKSLIDANVWTPIAYPQGWEIQP